jgi:hypothetical protein
MFNNLFAKGDYLQKKNSLKLTFHSQKSVSAILNFNNQLPKYSWLDTEQSTYKRSTNIGQRVTKYTSMK